MRLVLRTTEDIGASDGRAKLNFSSEAQHLCDFDIHKRKAMT
jgi:hypothetical protein